MVDTWFKLPENIDWKTRRLKWLVTLQTKKVDRSESDRPYVGLEHVEPWYGRLLPSPEAIENEDVETSEGTASAFECGDILFGKLRPYLAKAFCAEGAGCCSPELLVLTPGTEIDGHFLLYTLLTPDFIGLVNAGAFGAKMPRADWGTIGDIILPLPTLAQQQIIVDFLDHELQRLDQLVEARQRQLSLLEEKRRAIIAHAVTQGVDAQVPRRDSGLPWLGSIPAHWELYKISHLFSTGSGTTPKSDSTEYYGGNIPWITTSELRENVIRKTTAYVTELAMQDYSALKLFPVNSVVIAMYGATIGRIAILGLEATVNQACCVILPSEKCLPRYVFYYFQAIKSYLVTLALGGGQPNLSQETIRIQKITLPPVDEQKKIILWVENELKSLDNLESVIRKSICLLKQKRASLITAAVTGQFMPSANSHVSA